MQRSTSIRISGSRSVLCQQLFLVWLGIWWWAVGVIYLVRKGWQLCGAFSKFTSASYNFYYINLMPLAGRNIHIPGRRLPLFLPSVGGLLATAIYLRWPHFVLFTIPLSNSKDVMARWEDWIGDSHKPAFSCDHDFFNFSLVLVPSLPVSLLCVASLLRWYSLQSRRYEKECFNSSGIFGGYTGVVSASFAYISEVPARKNDLWIFVQKEDLNLNWPPLSS